MGLALGLGIPSGLLVWMGQGAWESAGPLTGEVADVPHWLLMMIGAGMGCLGGMGLLVAAGLALVGLLVGLMSLAALRL